MSDSMRHAAMLPLALVGAVTALVLLVTSVRVGDDGGIIDADSTRPAGLTSGSSAEPRSAAVMVAQDSLPSLLAEPKRVLEERKRFLDALEARYRREPVDAAWSVAAERALVDVAQAPALVETGIAPDAWSSRCRLRTCKITADFGDYDDAQDWANFFLTGTGSTLAQAELSIQRGADNATHVLIFGARR